MADLNTVVNEIVTKVNASLETITGHSHDGTDSPSIDIGIDSLTAEEYALANLLGGDL